MTQAVIGRIEIRQCGSLLPHRDVLSLLRGSTARMVRLWLVVLVAYLREGAPCSTGAGVSSSRCSAARRWWHGDVNGNRGSGMTRPQLSGKHAPPPGS